MDEKFCETMKMLKGVAAGDVIYSVFDARLITSLNQLIRLMERHIVQVDKGETPEIKEEEARAVADSILRIQQTMLLARVPQVIRNFVNGYMQLVYNWNRLAKNNAVAGNLQALNNFFNYHESTVETIRMMRRLLQVADSLLKTNPPAFELSKHYLDAIQEHLKEQNANSSQETPEVQKEEVKQDDDAEVRGPRCEG